MNAPFVDRSVLLRHVREIENAYGLSVIGVLPPDLDRAVGGQELTLLAEKTADISLLDLVKAEFDLGDRLGRSTRIVLKSGLKGRDAADLPAAAQPL